MSQVGRKSGPTRTVGWGEREGSRGWTIRTIPASNKDSKGATRKQEKIETDHLANRLEKPELVQSTKGGRPTRKGGIIGIWGNSE